MATHRDNRSKKDRSGRLADALRENLKRRKARERALTGEAKPEGRGTDTGAHHAPENVRQKPQ